MPYKRRVEGGRARPASRWKMGAPKIAKRHLYKMDKEQKALIKFGFVPQSQRIREPQPLTRQLVDVNPGGRDHAITVVRKVLMNEESDMNHVKMTQLWKALFYAYWMCDGAYKQHRLARRLSNFIKDCYSPKVAIEYMRCFWQCMEREWNGIDRLRLDKFQSLVRYFVHSAFDFMASNEWHYPTVCAWTSVLRHQVDLCDSRNRGLFLHICDVYIEELLNVCRVDADDWHKQRFRPPVTFDALYNLLAPFLSIYVDSIDMEKRQMIIRKVFAPLMDSMDFDSEKKERNLLKVGYNDLDLYKVDFLKKQRAEKQRQKMIRERQRVRLEIRQRKMRELVLRKQEEAADNPAIQTANVTEKELSEFLLEDDALKKHPEDYCYRPWKLKKFQKTESAEESGIEVIGDDFQNVQDFVSGQDLEHGTVDSKGPINIDDYGPPLQSQVNQVSRSGFEDKQQLPVYPLPEEEVDPQVILEAKGRKTYTTDCVGKRNERLRKTWKIGDKTALCSMAMRKVDPLNPMRMRRRRTPILFDKKNYSVTLPYREKVLGSKFREKELVEKYGHDIERRVYDPLLMEDKVRKFRTVLYSLIQNPDTPKRSVKHIEKLMDIFKFTGNDEFGYNRYAVREAVLHADDRNIRRKWRRAKNKRKIRNLYQNQKKIQRIKARKALGLAKDARVSEKLLKRTRNLFWTKNMKAPNVKSRI